MAHAAKVARRTTARRKSAHRARPKSMLKRVGKAAGFLALPIPDVELAVAAMANPDSGIRFVLGIVKKAGKRASEVQSVIFDKLKWTAAAAKQWLRDHNFTGTGKDEGATYWRFRQKPPSRYREFRTIVPGARNPRYEHPTTGNPTLKFGDEPYNLAKGQTGRYHVVDEKGFIRAKMKYGHTAYDYAGNLSDREPGLFKVIDTADGSVYGAYRGGEDVPLEGNPHEFRPGIDRVSPGYKVRFIRPDQVGELTELFHTARTALSGQASGRYERMLYAAKWFHKAHPEVSETAAYKDLDGLLSNYFGNPSVPSWENPLRSISDFPVGTRVSFFDHHRRHGETGVVVGSGRSSDHPWNVLQVRLDGDDEIVEVHPDRLKTMRNPTPGESIHAYDEHLATTLDPDFQTATPDEQAAAMTVQDALENPAPGVDKATLREFFKLRDEVIKAQDAKDAAGKALDSLKAQDLPESRWGELDRAEAIETQASFRFYDAYDDLQAFIRQHPELKQYKRVKGFANPHVENPVPRMPDDDSPASIRKVIDIVNRTSSLQALYDAWAWAGQWNEGGDVWLPGDRSEGKPGIIGTIAAKLEKHGKSFDDLLRFENLSPYLKRIRREGNPSESQILHNLDLVEGAGEDVGKSWRLEGFGEVTADKLKGQARLHLKRLGIRPERDEGMYQIAFERGFERGFTGRESNPEPIKVGDTVRYSTAFLRSIGAYTGPMGHARGLVTSIEDLGGTFILAHINWGRYQGELPDRVRVSNLTRVGTVEHNPGMSDLERRRLRLKQDFLVMLAEMGKFPENLHITDHPGAPTLAKIREFVYPEWEHSVDAKIRELAAAQSPKVGVPDFDALARRKDNPHTTRGEMVRLTGSSEDLRQRAFEAAKEYRLSGAYSETGVANARVAKYGFLKWYNNLGSRETKPYGKARLLKAWMEGWAVGKWFEKRQGNPKDRLKPGDKILGGYEIGPRGSLVRHTVPPLEPGQDYGADPLGDGTFRMVPSGDIVDLEERNRRLRRANPESDAARVYEDFHGRPAGETLEIIEEKLEHEWLTQLGLLVELKVAAVTKVNAIIAFDKDAPNLCCSEDCRQLYIEGGDQALDLAVLKLDGDKWLKDSMVIGVLYELTYQTKKGFHKFKLTEYFHRLGEETGDKPTLLYDPNNKKLSVSGGAYEIRDVGIVN